MDDMISAHFTPLQTRLASSTLRQAYLRGGIQEEWASEEQLALGSTAYGLYAVWLEG